MKNEIEKTTDIAWMMELILDLLFFVFSDSCLRGERMSKAIAFSAWLGLGEVASWKSQKILETLEVIDTAAVALENTVKNIEETCEAEHAPAADLRRKLIRTPLIIPYFIAIANNEKWDFQGILTEYAKGRLPMGKSFPPFPGKNAYGDVPAHGLGNGLTEDQAKKALVRFKMLGVDRTVTAQLGIHLDKARNVLMWRLYATLVGACIFATAPAERRKGVFSGAIISGYAYDRFRHERAEQKLEKTEAQKPGTQ
jgi:hypothetical protein